MADTVPSPQQPATGSQNQVPATAQNQSQPQDQTPAPSMMDQAQQQSQQAAQQAQQAAGQAMGQASQVTGQAGQLFGQAKQLLTAKPTQPQPPVAQDEKIWAALSYIPMIALVAFLIKPKSEFVKLHGRQGLLIFLIFFFSIFLYIILPPLGPILGGLVQLGMFVIGIFSIYQAITGNWWKTPVLGNIADMLPIDMFTNVATQAITGQEPSQTPPADQQMPAPDQTQPPAETIQNPPPAVPPAPTPPAQQ